jgi:hypothetical protein
MKIEVRPISISRWHKKTGKESFTRPKRVAALVNTDTMQYDTGLTEEEIQEFSEKLRVDLTPVFNPDQAHPYWDSLVNSVKLENNTMVFDTDNINDRIKIKMMKASKFVANSLKEYQEGMFPEATHVIFDESEEVEAKASKLAIKRQAILEAAKLSKGRKIQLILLINGKNLKGKSDNFIEVELDKIVEKDAPTLLRYMQRDEEGVSTEALVAEALQKSVLRKKGHKIMYHDSVLGTDIQDVATYLNLLEKSGT